MALTQRRDRRQSQTLVMTPQLQQAIKLLQLSNLELADYVEQELERNPLLEREDDGAGEPADLPESQPEVPTDRTGVDRLTSAESFAEGPEGPLDTEYANVWTGAGAAEADARRDGGEFAMTWGPVGRSDRMSPRMNSGH